tara:strand:- start:316 stop:498 length:183 start_codon:yes stop_codon:yes gene_type:complete
MTKRKPILKKVEMSKPNIPLAMDDLSGFSEYSKPIVPIGSEIEKLKEEFKEHEIKKSTKT